LIKFPNNCEGITKFYGITKFPETSNYALVFKLEDNDLRHCLNEYYNICSSKRKYIEDICSGLTNIHKHGLVHKDLHIGNVLCSNWKSAYISDFGFCRPANEISSPNIYGVIPYMAPEILRGKEYTQASDVYSLGIIINEVVSEIPPFCDQPHDYYLALDICHGLRPKIKEDVPEFMVEVIQKCWDANPDNRPTSEEILKIFKDGKSDKFNKLFMFHDSITIKKFTSSNNI
jgi:serine/threonine protein kinase